MLGPGGVVGGVFALVGALLAIVGTYGVYSANDIAWNGEETVGRIVEIRVNSSGRGRSYKPIYSFEDGKGIKHRGAHPIAASRRLFREGEAVPILYDPEDPRRSVINTAWGRFAFVFLILFALPFLAVGMSLVKRDRRAQDEEGIGWSNRRY